MGQSTNVSEQRRYRKRDWVINEFAWPISYKELNSYYEKILNLLFEKNIKKNSFLKNFQNSISTQIFIIVFVMMMYLVTVIIFGLQRLKILI